jgi:hypothetical protein
MSNSLYKKIMNNLSVFLYTSERHTPIAKLFVQEFNKFSNGLSIPKYVVSNNFKCETDFDSMGFKKINCNIPYCHGGSHFVNVMLESLKEINTDYILFFLEDYILTKDIKVDVLEQLMNVILNENVDHLSLMSYDHNGWETFDIDYNKYNLDKDTFLKINEKFLYMLSVQPCIWKKESLIKILEHNRGISIHAFDTTYVKNIKGQTRNVLNGESYETPSDFWDYGFKHISLKKNNLTSNYAFDEHNGEDNYFLFLYSEIMRHGKFNTLSHNNNRIFLEKFLKENNINKQNPEYSNYFYND